MNEQARKIMAGMEAMARGQARDDSTQTIKWCGLTYKFYPASNTDGWYHRSPDITKRLTRMQVVSLINIELGDVAEARKETRNDQAVS